MASDDAFVFVDELLSFFASDAEDEGAVQQQLVAGDTEAAAEGDGDALRFLPGESLSAEEVAEILRSVQDEEEESEYDDHQDQRRGLLEQTQQQRDANSANGGKPSSAKKTKKASRNYDPNRARNGRREELGFLRMTARELETRLSVLREKKARNSMSTRTASDAALSSSASLAFHHHQQQLCDSNPNEALLRQHSELHEVWREVARHQYDERRKSERENLQLRVVLENQLKVARSLEKFLLLKAAATKVGLRGDAASWEIRKCVDLPRNPHQFPYPSHLSSAHPSDAALFQDLLAGVEQSIAQVDAIFEANGFQHMETTQMNAQVRFAPEKGGLFVEVCATKVLPFAIHETGEAVWNHCTFAKQRMPSRSYSYSHKSIDATDDTSVEDFTLELLVKKTSASFRVRQIVRRVIEDERVVIVWHSFSDPIEFSKQKLSGLRLFEKGYTVIRKSPSSAPDSCVTLVQSYNIVSTVPILEGAGVILRVDDTVIGEITDFTLCETTEFVEGRHQMVENALMEQALKRDSSSSVTSSGT